MCQRQPFLIYIFDFIIISKIAICDLRFAICDLFSYNRNMRSRDYKLKPQDVLIALKILLKGSKPKYRHIDLAYELGMSQSEVSSGLGRLSRCGLFEQNKQSPKKASILEFLVHGLKYVFPAEIGGKVRGILTAHSYGPLAKIIRSEERYVWPYEDGNVRGIAVSPIFRSVPEAALKDEKLHELLAIVESLRMGRVRERQIAEKELKKILNLESKEVRNEHFA